MKKSRTEIVDLIQEAIDELDRYVGAGSLDTGYSVLPIIETSWLWRSVDSLSKGLGSKGLTKGGKGCWKRLTDAANRGERIASHVAEFRLWLNFQLGCHTFGAGCRPPKAEESSTSFTSHS